jgi:hypothetical protein
MKKLKYILIIYLAIGSALVYSNDVEYKNGYAGSFLRIGLGAVNQGMGNAGVAMPKTSAAFYYNPALLPQNETMSAATGYSFMSLDRKFNYIGFTLPLPPSAAVSVNWIHAGVDDIQGRSYSGVPDEKYSTGEDAVMLSFGNRLSEKLSIGFSIKYLRHSLLDISGTGVGFDAGAYYKILDNLAFGVQAKDLNSSYNWKTSELFEEEGGNYIEKFPAVFKAGLMYGVRNFQIIADIASIEKKYYFHGGVQYQYEDIAALRIGYDRNSFTFGCGLQYDFMWNTKTELDYAFVREKFGEGHSHVFTWNFKI